MMIFLQIFKHFSNLSANLLIGFATIHMRMGFNIELQESMRKFLKYGKQTFTWIKLTKIIKQNYFILSVNLKQSSWKGSLLPT